VEQLIAILHDDSPQLRERFWRPALIGPDDGPWINELPPAFVKRLAALDESAAERIGQEWAMQERADIASIQARFTRDHMLAHQDLAYWRAMLDRLAEFARAAIAEGRGMYMWMSL
jgi:hypothetical protein